MFKHFNLFICSENEAVMFKINAFYNEKKSYSKNEMSNCDKN